MNKAHTAHTAIGVFTDCMLSFCNGWISFSRGTADSNVEVAPEASVAHLKCLRGVWACAMMFSVKKKKSLCRGNVKSLFKPKAKSDEPE